jgi:hypothetical protein
VVVAASSAMVWNDVWCRMQRWGRWKLGRKSIKLQH